MKDLLDKEIDYQAHTESHPYYGQIRYQISKSKEKRRIIYKAYAKHNKKQMSFLLSSICYHLFHLFQEAILEGRNKKIGMNTYRERFQKIAVKVIYHAGKIILSYTIGNN